MLPGPILSSLSRRSLARGTLASSLSGRTAPSLHVLLVQSSPFQRSIATVGKMTPRQTIHTSPNRSVAPANQTLLDDDALHSPELSPEAPKSPGSKAPLSVLPLSTLLRSIVITTMSSSRLFLPPSLALMSFLANTKSYVFSPDHNPLVGFLVKHTIYAQFCAGESPAEVAKRLASLKDMGFTGAILSYAKEVVLSDEEKKALSSGAAKQDDGFEESVKNEIGPWEKGTLDTLMVAAPGDFVALKFTGAGRQALYTLAENLPPPPPLAAAIENICNLAASRGIRLLFDAEQASIQSTIDDWTLTYMRKYNITPGKALIYGTYQAYLKATPAVLKSHLLAARKADFTLGVKLVRGAYLGSDPRHLIHDTKEQTDKAYDALARSILTQTWSPEPDILPGTGPFPPTNLVLATHNADSVRKAREICTKGEAKIEAVFAQLQGMADEVSCELLPANKSNQSAEKGRVAAYKYLVWGSTGECMKYLLRRAYENRDAVQRTRDSRDAAWGELFRRVRGLVGFS